MLATELKYGIWDNHTKSWLLCEFGEGYYDEAQALANWKNDKHNGIRPSDKAETEKSDKGNKGKSSKKKVIEKEYIQRYIVKARD